MFKFIMLALFSMASHANAVPYHVFEVEPGNFNCTTDFQKSHFYFRHKEVPTYSVSIDLKGPCPILPFNIKTVKKLMAEVKVSKRFEYEDCRHATNTITYTKVDVTFVAMPEIKLSGESLSHSHPCEGEGH